MSDIKNSIKTIGILGAGQLGLMLGEAAEPLGLSVICYADNKDSPAAKSCEIFIGKLSDQDSLREFANSIDVITFETENIPKETVEFLASIKPVYPSYDSLRTAQDRLFEKQLFNQLNIPTNPYYAVNTLEDLEKFAAELNYRAVLKIRRSGYDGKGQYRILQKEDITPAWKSLGGEELLLEAFVPFDKECSVLAARNPQGDVTVYPITQNIHKNGILELSLVPFNYPAIADLKDQLESYITAVLTQLDHVGMLAIEFFLKEKQIIANEMAPRVHNSGHWTIEGAHTSQFTNHLLAITNQALGNSQAKHHSIMINCIGNESLQEKLNHEGAAYHSYHKTARPGRKLAHATYTTDDLEDFETKRDFFAGVLV